MSLSSTSRQYQHHLKAIQFSERLAAGYALQQETQSDSTQDVDKGAAALIQLLGMAAPNDGIAPPYAPVQMPSEWIDVQSDFLTRHAISSAYAFDVFYYAIFESTSAFADAICAHLTEECDELTGDGIKGKELYNAATGTKTSYKSSVSSAHIYLNVYTDNSREIAFDSWRDTPDVYWAETQPRYRVWFKQHGADWAVNTMSDTNRAFAGDVRFNVLELLLKPCNNSKVVELRASFVDATLKLKQ